MSADARVPGEGNRNRAPTCAPMSAGMAPNAKVPNTRAPPAAEPAASAAANTPYSRPQGSRGVSAPNAPARTVNENFAPTRASAECKRAAPGSALKDLPHSSAEAANASAITQGRYGRAEA